ncbi:hypothetical protein [Pseudoalteromonas luteoviolacea]|uniref:Uncharacterized protein n=1 Tax=Pseudoalteromonas luteoviolacea S4060-1 TaxID=1365257 RepID=A0A167PAU2_9GAMM|nr:hypothetical protein [Pseudoalteromonas luteoviolacea]KZN69877.1 hypothetical protein N478_10295 [Pseudoalteromonas luteoviolacea S4060-1]
MKLVFNKKKMKNLSLENKSLPVKNTPQIGGAAGYNSFDICPTYDARCTSNYLSRAC